MSGLSIAFAVVGCALFGVALLFIFGLFAIGLSLTAVAVPADHARASEPRLPPVTLIDDHSAQSTERSVGARRAPAASLGAAHL
jgi:hypothetical protein